MPKKETGLFATPLDQEKDSKALEGFQILLAKNRTKPIAIGDEFYNLPPLPEGICVEVFDSVFKLFMSFAVPDDLDCKDAKLATCSADNDVTLFKGEKHPPHCRRVSCPYYAPTKSQIDTVKEALMQDTVVKILHVAFGSSPGGEKIIKEKIY